MESVVLNAIDLVIHSSTRSNLNQHTVADHMLLLRTWADQVVLETFTDTTHPPNSSCRISDHQREVWHISGDNSTGSYEAKHSERMAAYHRCIRSDRRPSANLRFPKFLLARDVGSRIVHVGEHATWSAKDVVGQLDAIIDRDVVLDLAAVADAYVRSNHHVLSDRAVLADHGTGQDMTKVPDLCASADHGAVVYKTGDVDRDTRKPRIFPHFAHAPLALIANG